MGAKVSAKSRRRAGARSAKTPRRRRSDRAARRRLTIVRLNRYGLAFARNRTPVTYTTSGRNFSSYYRFACTRCGFSFAQATWKHHTLADCDLTIRAFADKSIPMNRFEDANLFGR